MPLISNGDTAERIVQTQRMATRSSQMAFRGYAHRRSTARPLPPGAFTGASDARARNPLRGTLIIPSSPVRKRRQGDSWRA